MGITGGYYIVAKKIQDSKVMRHTPCTREIWQYLLRNAAYQKTNDKGHCLQRGQLFRKYKDIRDDLAWHRGYRKETYSKSQTTRSMTVLMTELMIELMTVPGGVIITICNYDYYQDFSNYDRNDDRTDDRNHDRNHDRTLLYNKEEGSKGSKGKKGKKEVKQPHVSQGETVCGKNLSTEETNLSAEVEVGNVFVQARSAKARKAKTYTQLPLPLQKAVGDVIDYLNTAAAREYRKTSMKTVLLILALLRDDFSVEDMQTVVSSKTKEWQDDLKMKKFLRPSTLFGSKFEEYLQAAPKKVKAKKKDTRTWDERNADNAKKRAAERKAAGSPPLEQKEKPESNGRKKYTNTKTHPVCVKMQQAQT